MAKVFIEGDHEACELIGAALRSAGLSTVDVEFVVRTREVTPLPAAPGNWAALADLSPDLGYADWRDEVLSLVDAAEAGPVRPVVTDLRRAG
jgi:hypothetical protein